MSAYTVEEKIQIIKWRYSENSLTDCVNLFIATFENRPTPSATTIHRIISHFEKKGCIQDCRKCHKKEDPTPNNNNGTERRDVMVCSTSVLDDTRSSRNVAEEMGISHVTVQKIWKNNGLKCFKYRKTQEIFPEDQFRRMEFCETMMEKVNHDQHFIRNILFTDESTFPLHGKHNSSVMRYWSEENQHRSVAVRTQYPQKLNVWAGLLGNHVIGPFFIDGNLNGQKYLELLQNQVLPTVRALPDINMETIWFQQDGCPCHNTLQVRDFINNTFPDRVIGLHGNIKWPARSPDLTPLDFFCGVI